MSRNTVHKRENGAGFDLVMSVFTALAAEYWLFVLLGAYVFDSINTSTMNACRAVCVLLLCLSAVYALCRLTTLRRAGEAFKAFFKRIFCPEQLLILGILPLFVVTCAAMKSETGVDVFHYNRHYLLDACVCVLLLFPLPAMLKKYPVIPRAMLMLLVGATFFFDAWAMVGVLKPSVVTVGGNQIGMNSHFALCFACNENTTGAYHAMLFMLCVYFIVREKKLWVKTCFVPAVLLNLFILGLSDSRTALYSVLIAFGIVAGALVIRFGWRRTNRLSVRVAYCGAAVFAAAAAALLIYYTPKWSYALYDAATGYIRPVSGGGGSSESWLTGRELLWRSFLPAVTESPRRFLFGVTPIFVEQQITLQGIIDATGRSYMHNQYLQMGVAFGVPSMILYTVWTVLLAIKCVKSLKSYSGIALSGVIFMLVVANMLESYLFGFAYFCGGVFFLMAGMINADVGTEDVYAEVTVR